MQMLFVRNNINPKITKNRVQAWGFKILLTGTLYLRNKKVFIKNDNLHFIISLPIIKRKL